ncbi:hypothetical protein [Luteolibacter soli]|uniref:Tyr recombinase domain-containing protein n=1 Tax=Luteolibacter soli TaxID=3135280 RepID=A0ABU9ARU0_9BACT
MKRDFSTEEDAAKWGEEESTRLREFGRRTLEIPPRVQDYLQRFALNALFEKNLDEHQIRRLLEEALHRFKPAQDHEPLWSFYPEFRHRRNWSEETLARGAARVYENELKPFLQNERLGSFTSLESGLRLATRELDDWAARYAAKTGEPPAHRTFLNHRNALGTFFRHLAKRDLVPHSLPVQIREIASKDLRSTIKKETGESIHVLAPDLIELILQTAPQFHLAHFLVLKALCGMRDKEAANLTWDCLKEDHVFVPAEISKIGKSRRISFEDVPGLGKWLAFADAHGRPRRKTVGGARARREGHWLGLVESLREQLCLAEGESWGDKYPNALRDSFCSYGCLVLDYTKVQMICGHHVGSHTTFRRYISSNVTKANAKAFFALHPPTA